MNENVVVWRGQLITRQSARMEYNRIVNLLEKHKEVVVDLAQVELITPSFADECFGTLAEQRGKGFFRKQLRLKGASSDVKHLISVVIANRLKRME